MHFIVKTTKKELVLTVLLAVLFSIFVCSIIFLSKKNLMGIWFFVGLIMLSIYLFAKSILFRSDSSLYLATNFQLFGLLGIVHKFAHLQPLIILSAVIFIFAISHLVLYLFFNNIRNFYYFIFLFLLFLPLILYHFYCITLLIMILLLCGDFAVFLLLQLFKV